MVLLLRRDVFVGLALSTSLQAYAASEVPAASATADKSSAEGSPAKAAAPEASADADADAASAGENLDVDAIKKKYWATGDESQLGVVQNRLYSKANKFQFGLAGGMAMSDPFLTLRPWSGSFGYNFNEFFALNAYGGKISSRASNALVTLREGEKEANTVIPKNYWGVEGMGSLLYGKLSLMGASIIYYDFYVTGGAGSFKTEWDRSLSLSAGVGQRFYVTRWLSLKVDYKALRYKETVKEKEKESEIGQVIGTRTNWTHTLMFGLDFLVGVF